MSILMRNNHLGTGQGGKCFDVLTNICPGFEFGEQDGDDLWLEGRIVDGQFIFNGRLFTRNGHAGAIFDSFPARQASNGWTQRRRLDAEGYELVDSNGEIIFSYRVDGNICTVDIDLYQKDGSLGVHRGQDGLVCHVSARVGGMQIARR